ncbi:MAG: hypothetical protein ABSE41_14050 [Bacteroidota bacterium]
MKKSILMCCLGAFFIGCNHYSVGPEPGPASNTAQQRLGNVNSLASGFGKGLHLMSVNGRDVGPDGTSGEWQYEFIDASMPPTAYWFHATSNSVAFDSNSAMRVGSAIIAHPWFNSDAALGFAERNGGAQFRTANPRFTIFAYMGEPVVPNPTTNWWISYYSKDDNTRFLLFTVDANTGTTKVYGPD